jgi:hypothetical protein
MADEVGWYEHAGERVLGLLIRDLADNDFGGYVFGRDRKLRFRAVSSSGFDPRRRHAEIALRRELERVSAEPDDDYYQGDEAGSPVDFFATVVPEDRLNPSYLRVRELEQYSGARGIIEPMMRWYGDVDGNFVEQFQTTGFDSRLWELYLFAAFSEMGFNIDRIHAVPDFTCVNPLTAFCVEATTVNPTRDPNGEIVPPPPTETPEQLDAYLKDYMPIKFGSALTSKLAKKYWTRPHVKGKPFVLAIHDFSSPQSMMATRSAFEHYIYGVVHDWNRDENGKLIIHPKRIGAHRWGAKEIHSGFFDLPDSENVSAVLFSNSGTVAKFNRMGLLAGFASRRLRLVRIGTAVDHNPDSTTPVAFKHEVNDPSYQETWCEGIDIWHNPRAKIPLDRDLLPRVAHHNMLPDGQIVNLTPDWHPFGSMTLQSLADEDI